MIFEYLVRIEINRQPGSTSGVATQDVRAEVKSILESIERDVYIRDVEFQIRSVVVGKAPQ